MRRSVERRSPAKEGAFDEERVGFDDGIHRLMVGRAESVNRRRVIRAISLSRKVTAEMFLAVLHDVTWLPQLREQRFRLALRGHQPAIQEEKLGANHQSCLL